MPISDDLRRKLSLAHSDALRVGDSPLRADRLADTLAQLSRTLAESKDLEDDLRSRIQASLADAERVLRRDDDGREAARHLQAAQRLAEGKPRRESPFLDD